MKAQENRGSIPYFCTTTLIGYHCMATYSLYLNFSNDDWQDLHSRGAKVMISKPGNSRGQQFPWITFDPYQSNTVTWAEDYAIYASTQQTHSPEPVFLPLSPMPAQKGRKYIYNEGGGLNERPQGEAETILVRNRLDSPVGLEIELKLDGWANGIDYPNQTAMTMQLEHGADWQYAPEPTWEIWLQAPGEAPTPASLATIRPGQYAANLNYDGDTQLFTQA